MYNITAILLTLLYSLILGKLMFKNFAGFKVVLIEIQKYFFPFTDFKMLGEGYKALMIFLVWFTGSFWLGVMTTTMIFNS